MRYFMTVLLTLVGQSAFAQTATEKADKRLADLLTPGSVAHAPLTAKMTQWPASRVVSDIEAPIKPPTAAPVKLTLTPLKEVKPRSAPEGTPLVAYREPTVAPEAVQLPTKPLIKLPSLDTKTPAPIPILAQPVKDRASLGDPAFDASLAATMKQLSVARDRPVPFTPLNLPDPFEHLRYGQLRNPPEESATPPLIPLRKPTK